MDQNQSRLTPQQTYLDRHAAFQRSYLRLIIICSVAITVGIAVALIFNLLVGLAIAALTAAAYIYFSVTQARKLLGVSFKNIDGAITVTALSADENGIIFVPDRLIYADVQVIGDGALDTKIPIVELYIPLGIEKIGKSSLPEDSTTAVFYEGSAEKWQRIDTQTEFSPASVHFECDFPRPPQKQKKAKKTKTEDTP